MTPDGRLSPFIDPLTGDVAIRDLRTGASRRLTIEGTGTEEDSARAISLALSRDGKRIAYVWRLAQQLQCRIVNVDGSGKRTVQPKEKLYFFAIRDWSSDGRAVLLAATTIAPPLSGYVILDVNSGEARRIKVDSAPWAETAGFSRDGRWIVFSESKYKRPEWDLRAVEVDTGNIISIVAGEGANRKPVWIPDQDIVLFRSDRSGKNAIWSVKIQDGKAAAPPVLLKADSGDYNPVGVARDGVLYYSLRHETSDIYLAVLNPETLRVEKEPVRRVHSNPGRNSGAAWSPSGKSFAYYSERENETRVVIRHAPDKEVDATDTIRWTEPVPVWCGEDRLLVWGIPNFYTIRLLDAATGSARGADHAFKIDYPAKISAYSMGVSTDCASAYVYTQIRETNQRRIYRHDMGSRQEAELLRDSGGWISYSTASPDGRWLITQGKLPGGKAPGLLIMPASGGEFRMLDPQGLSGYSFTPDSKRILYARRPKGAGEEDPNRDLYWISVEGGEPQPVGIRLSAKNIVTSLNADGRRLLYSAGESTSELWVLRNLPVK